MSAVSVYPPPPPTRNTLTSSRRTQLIRTTSKLGRVLGSTPTILDLNLGDDDELDSPTGALGSYYIPIGCYSANRRVDFTDVFSFTGSNFSASSPIKDCRRMQSSGDHIFTSPNGRATPSTIAFGNDASPDYFTDILNLYSYSSSSDFDLHFDPEARPTTPSPPSPETSSDSISLQSLTDDSSLSTSWVGIDYLPTCGARQRNTIYIPESPSLSLPSTSKPTTSRSSPPTARKRSGSLPMMRLPRRLSFSPPRDAAPSTPGRPTLPPAHARTPSTGPGPRRSSHDSRAGAAECADELALALELASPLAPAFQIPSESAVRRAKMERLRRRLGECVPVELVFPRGADDDGAGGLPHLTDRSFGEDEEGGAVARHEAEARVGIATKVGIRRAAPPTAVVTRARSRSLGDVRDVGLVRAGAAPAPAEEAGERHLAKTRVPFLWRKKLDVIVEQEMVEGL